jgi:hypothetical protein
MMTKWWCAATLVMSAGCLDGATPFDGTWAAPPSNGGAACDPPSCVQPSQGDPMLDLKADAIDGAAQSPAAVGGTYHIHFNVGPADVTSLDPALTGYVNGANVDVVASAPTIGTIEIANPWAWDSVTMEADDVADAIVTMPTYAPLDQLPVQFLGPNVTGAVRLRNAQGGSLVDHSLALTSATLDVEADQFTATKAGDHKLTATAYSLHAPVALDVPVVDAIDDLVLVTTGKGIGEATVCAHAMRGGDEVFAQFQATTNGALGASLHPNCFYLSIYLSISDTTLTVSAGGLTRQVVLAPTYGGPAT